MSARAGTAPPSVAGPRRAAHEAQRRYSAAVLRASQAALGRLWGVLGTPAAQQGLIERAWAALADERKRDLPTLRRRVEAVCWSVSIQDRLPPNLSHPILQALDGVPASKWAAGSEAVLEELGAAVAERMAWLSELT